MAEKRTKAVKAYFTEAEYNQIRELAGWMHLGTLLREVMLVWAKKQGDVTEREGNA